MNGESLAEDTTIKGAQSILAIMASSFEEGGSTKYARSDILKALLTPMAGTAVAFPPLLWSQAPKWALIGDAAIFLAFTIMYFACYLYCFIWRPASLRSEKFELTKYAIEKKLFGDSDTGLIEAGSVASNSSQQLFNIDTRDDNV